MLKQSEERSGITQASPADTDGQQQDRLGGPVTERQTLTKMKTGEASSAGRAGGRKGHLGEETHLLRVSGCLTEDGAAVAAVGAEAEETTVWNQSTTFWKPCCVKWLQEDGAA